MSSFVARFLHPWSAKPSDENDENSPSDRPNENPDSAGDDMEIENEEALGDDSTSDDGNDGSTAPTKNHASRMAIATSVTSDSKQDEDDRKVDSESNSDASDESDSDSQESDSDESDSDDDEDSPNDGISAYERLRIERIRRNQERLAQLGLVDQKKQISKQRRKKRPIGGNQDKDHEIPMRSQPKRSAKTKISHGEFLIGGQIDLRRNQPFVSYKNRFSRSKEPKAKKLPNMYTARYSCGECRTCTREGDCGTCFYCSVNQRQDSGELVATKSRRRCLFKYCFRRLIDVEVDVETETEDSSQENSDIEEKTGDSGNAPLSGKANESEAIADSIDNSDDKMDCDDKVDVATRMHDVTEVKDYGSNKDGEKDTAEVTKSNIKIDLDSINPASKKNDSHSQETLKSATEVEKKTPMEYLAPYLGKQESDEYGFPLWLDEFQQFLATVPHGAQNKVSGQKNVDSTMSQVCKLVSGQGVTYHLWPDGTYFKKGLKIHLGMDLHALHGEAVAWEKKYRDLRKGSLLRHPVMKLVCFKEWIESGKPRAAIYPPSPIRVHSSAPNLTTDNERTVEGQSDKVQNGKKKLIPKRLEDCIKPNRIRWAESTKINKSNIDDSKVGNDPKMAKTNSTCANKKSNIVDDNLAKTKGECSSITGCAVCSKGGDLICCDLCDRGYHSNCHFPKIKEIPTGDWICRECKPKKSPYYTSKRFTAQKREVVINCKLFEGEHDDDCFMCYLGGDLICCDFCEKAFHLDCHIPRLPFVPEGRWKCCECTALERKKMSRCGECEACIRDDCGKCKHCLDKPKFGGANTIRQTCVKKACPYPRLAPPAPTSTAASATWKRRGRPRKSVGDDNNNGDAMGMHVKRGRGRPRKSVDGEAIGSPIKRGPGRPRKSMDGEAIGSPIKRGPGRPRKSMDGEAIGSPIKRGPGRPRKSMDGEAIGSPIKRGPGRPRKSMDGKDIGSPIKRGPGRPRKSMDGKDIGSPKRGPGRPRKSMDGKDIGSPIKRGPGRPRKSMDGKDIGSPKRGPGRPRKSMDGKDIGSPKRGPGRPRKSMESETSSNFTGAKKRGRPRKSVDGHVQPSAKRTKVVTAGPVIFKFKISSFKSAYRDPESTKIRKVIKTALRDPSDAKVVDKACELLRKCIKSVEDVKKIILFGGVEVLHNAMTDHPDKCILQAEACCTIAELLWVFPSISKKLIHMGIIDLIVTAIHHCPNNSKVQQMGLGALGAFSYDANSVKYIENSGGLRAVMNAMERFPKKLSVQKEGCYFLQNLVVRSADTFAAVSNSQIIPIIVDAITNPEADTELLLSVCGLIANLALDTGVKKLISRANAIPSLLSIFTDTRDLELKQQACTALRHLAIESSDNQRQISAEGGIDAVFNAISSFPDDPVLLIISLNIMKELCINDEEVAHGVAQKSGIKIILKAMEKNSDLPAMQIAACEVIGYLVLKGRNEAQAPKLANAIIAAMKNHSSDSDVQIQACDALFELSRVPSTRLILKKKETRDILLRARKKFKDCRSDVDDIIAATKN